MRIYIDTSVINGLYAQAVPWIEEATKNFFKVVKDKNYKLYISDIVSDEIKRTPDAHKRGQLLDVVREYACKELSQTTECETLANKYTANKIIPDKYSPDAMHIAIASVYKIPILVSWNFKHMVRHKTRIGVNAVNKASAYDEIDICSPEEVD